MAIIKKCQKCSREGRYAVNENDEICARCVANSAAADGTNDDNTSHDNDQQT